MITAKNDVKKKVINALKGDLEVTEINRLYDESEIIIKAKFIYHGKFGSFTYTLIGTEIGIEECDFDAEEDEDIYNEIHDWVENNISVRTIVKCCDKIIK